MHSLTIYNRSQLSWKTDDRTYIVATLQRPFHILVHVVMIESHEKRIHDNAQCDKQFGERIEDQPRNAFLELEPRPAAVPHAKYIEAAAERFEGFVA